MEEQAKKNDVIENFANNAEELDLSVELRFCNICDHDAEDGY